MISPLIKWDHGDEWTVSKYDTNDVSSEWKVVVNINDNASAYMKGHIVDGESPPPRRSIAISSIFNAFFRSLPVAGHEHFAFGARIVGAHDTWCHIGDDERSL